jgi:autotransporter translocation and assembly factor TamB
MVNTQPHGESIVQPRLPVTVKTLEIDLHHISSNQTIDVDEKLELTHRVATKAIEASSSETVELAQQHILYQTLDHKHRALQEKKGTRKVSAKRGHHLVDADDIAKTQRTWGKENFTPLPPRQSFRSRME